jgi:ATP-dependent helicase HrpB
VRLLYAEPPQERGRALGIGEAAAWGIRKSLSEVEGDLLVFLPGQREIREAAEKVQAFAREKSLRILPLYGEQSLEEQDAALAAYSERKVILATNIAETSLTIAGVRGVVDTGWARKLRYDTGCGLNRLETERISEASATQRKGRAGREAEGYALRLWSPSLALDAQDEPEIRRIELSALLLQMLAWGERELSRFPWVSAPSEVALEQSLELLALLAATKQGDLTEKGKKMAEIPLEPRLSAFLLEAQERGVAEDAAWLAALLSERHPFSQRLQEQTPRHLSDIESDLLDQWSLLREVGEGASWASYNEERSYKRLHQIQQQLLALLGVPARKKPASFSLGEREGHLARALLAGYVDRLALRRPQEPQRAILASGRGLRMAKSCQVKRAALFLALTLDAGKREERAEAWVQEASAVEESWLPRESLREEVAVYFDDERERVMGVKKRMFRHLVLHEQSIQPPEDKAASLLAEAAASQLGRALGLDEEKRQQFLLRLRLFSRWLPEWKTPAFDEAYLLERLPMWCEGKRSFQALREMPLEDLLLGDLTYAQATALREEIPERIEVPSGSLLQIEYREDAPPILAVRIQEIFGWYDTPCLAQGRVPLLLHLLAPNHRPQQITQDLRSFWKSAYPEIRKELKQRYPKHAWPDDPLTAKAERRPQRRTSS